MFAVLAHPDTANLRFMGLYSGIRALGRETNTVAPPPARLASGAPGSRGCRPFLRYMGPVCEMRTPAPETIPWGGDPPWAMLGKTAVTRESLR